MDYLRQAIDFLAKTNTDVNITFSHNGKHFHTDTENRDIYKVKISRAKRSFSFDFGQSINGTVNKQKPNEYDILACLTKYDPETFENFCSEYGYDIDSRTAKKTYKAVEKEYANVCKIWTDEEIEELQEIQ